MQVHICIPYRTDKNLGKAYNETMQRIPEGDWACLIDYDVNLLTPDAGAILHEYARLFPDAGILTCFTNRISTLSSKQLLNGEISENTNYLYHYQLAVLQKQRLYTGSVIMKDISGFLMMVSKKTWVEFPFPEDGKCLGVDTDYNRRIRAAGKEIIRMNGLYVFHAYRMVNGISDKSHLQ